MLWNGRECPFANFSEPEKREGGREKSRGHSGSGSFSERCYERKNESDLGDTGIDENQNCVESRERKEGGREDQQAVFTRFVAYMDQIQDRLGICSL